MKPVISYYGGKQRMSSKIVPLIPRHTVYGSLTVLDVGRVIVGKKGSRQYFSCVCVCGNVTQYRMDSLKAGKATQCRPCSRKQQAKKMVIHGKTANNSKSKAFGVWDGMYQRCTNKNSQAYKDYGGRGISIEWASFADFLRDMGEPNAGMTIERKNNDGNYSKENCHWATRREQQNNRRTNNYVTFMNTRMTLTEAAMLCGKTLSCVRSRILRGADLFTALTAPLQSNNRDKPAKVNYSDLREEIQKLYDTGAYDCFAKDQEVLF